MPDYFVIFIRCFLRLCWHLLFPPGSALGVHPRSGQRIWNDGHNSGDGEEGGDANQRVDASSSADARDCPFADVCFLTDCAMCWRKQVTPAIYASDEHPGKAGGDEGHSNTPRTSFHIVQRSEAHSHKRSAQIQSRGDRLQEPEDPAPLGFGNQVAKHGLTDRCDHLSWTMLDNRAGHPSRFSCRSS